MLQCCLYCECNVSANRTQSDESWLSKAMLRRSLTSRMQCQCQPNAELENLFSKVLLRCSLTSRMQCQCQPNAELENLFSKVLLRCSLTSRMQRYNMHNPKSKFFSLPNIAPRKFFRPPNVHSALYLWAFRCIFHTRKKNEIGI